MSEWPLPPKMKNPGVVVEMEAWSLDEKIGNTIEVTKHWGMSSDSRGQVRRWFILVADELATTRTALESSRARVAVLEEALRNLKDFFKVGMRGYLSHEVTDAGRVLVNSSPPTPGEAWRAMVAALSDLIGLAEAAMKDASRDGAEYAVDAELSEARAALAAARQVMGT